MNITANKQNKVFRPDSVYTLSAQEINQIVAELMSVIDWAGLTPSSDPNAPQIVEALTAMLLTRTEAGLKMDKVPTAANNNIPAFSSAGGLVDSGFAISTALDTATNKLAVNAQVKAAIEAEALARITSDGILSNLTTAEKSNLVAAINEVYGRTLGINRTIGSLYYMASTAANMNSISGTQDLWTCFVAQTGLTYYFNAPSSAWVQLPTAWAKLNTFVRTISDRNGLTPTNGMTCGVLADGNVYAYNGTAWVAHTQPSFEVGDQFTVGSFYGTWNGGAFTGNAVATLINTASGWAWQVTESTPIDNNTLEVKNGVLQVANRTTTIVENTTKFASGTEQSFPTFFDETKNKINGIITALGGGGGGSSSGLRFSVSAGSWTRTNLYAWYPYFVRKVDNANALLYATAASPVVYSTASGVTNTVAASRNFNITTPARKFVVGDAAGNITLSPAFSYGKGAIDNSFFPSYIAGSLSGGNDAKTGFSASNFLVSRALFAPGPNAWEIGTKFTLSALGNNPIISSGGIGNESNYRLHVFVIGSELQFLVSDTGAIGSWITVSTGSEVIAANTPYWIKCKFDGVSTYTLSLSNDGVNYTNYTLNSSTIISRRATALVLGRSTYGDQYLSGTLDLTQTYFSYQGVRIAPAAEITDAIYYDTAIGKSYKYNGTAWVEFDCCVLGEILLKNSGSLVARAYPFNLDWNNLEDRGVIDSTALYYMPSTIEMPRAGKSITTISSINGATPYASDNMVNINDYVIFGSSLAVICPFKNKLDMFRTDLYRN